MPQQSTQYHRYTLCILAGTAIGMWVVFIVWPFIYTPARNTWANIILTIMCEIFATVLLLGNGIWILGMVHRKEQAW